MHEFEVRKLNEENEELKAKLEEVSRKADEETNKRTKAEAEMKQGQEVIEMLRRSLGSRSMSRTEARKEEAPQRGSREDRRSRVWCWDLSRPGGCQYGSACRYLHPDFHEAPTRVRAEQGRGATWPPASLGCGMAGQQPIRMSQQSMRLMMNQQQMVEQQRMMSQQMMMNQQKVMSQQRMMSHQQGPQQQVVVVQWQPRMVYRWPTSQ